MSQFCKWFRFDNRVFVALLVTISWAVAPAQNDKLLRALRSPILLQGDAMTAYRDPLIAYIGKRFYLFYSYVRTEEDRKVYWYVAYSTSADLQHWTAPHILTPKSQNLNFASPGSLTKVGDDWVLSLCTLPMNNVRMDDKIPPIHWPEDTSRLWTMQTLNFKTWSKPELLRVKGPDVPQAAMGRMIDPTLVRDKDMPGKWWVVYKQAGKLHEAYSMDMKNWTPVEAPITAGENPEVFIDKDANEYVLFYSPKNGTGVMRSTDMLHWHEAMPPITLGQNGWPYAETRITAGYVADMRNVPGVGRYVLVCHTMGPGKVKTYQVLFANDNVVIAWSDDLKTWRWPGEGKTAAKDGVGQ